jgi:hypothetical protein
MIGAHEIRRSARRGLDRLEGRATGLLCFAPRERPERVRPDAFDVRILRKMSSRHRRSVVAAWSTPLTLTTTAARVDSPLPGRRLLYLLLDVPTRWRRACHPFGRCGRAGLTPRV